MEIPAITKGGNEKRHNQCSSLDYTNSSLFNWFFWSTYTYTWILRKTSMEQALMIQTD